MSKPKAGSHWPGWIAAGLHAHRGALAVHRARLLCRAGVPDEVKRRGAAAYDAIIAEVDTQIRDVALGWLTPAGLEPARSITSAVDSRAVSAGERPRRRVKTRGK